MAFPQVFYSGSGNNSRRGPSPIIWSAGQFPLEAVREDPNLGAELWEDWLNVNGDASPVSAQVTTVTGSSGTWKLQAGPTTFGSFNNVATGAAAGPSVISEDIGAVSFKSLAAAHDNAGIEPGNSTTAPVGRWGINSTAGSLPKLAFECKIKIDAADATQAFFVGLAEANLTNGTNNLFSSGDALQNKSIIGLFANATSAITPVYGKNGQSPVTVGSTTGTLVANTYTKLGWLYDPTDTTNGVLRYYQDGVLIGKVATLPSSTTFPSGVALNAYLMVHNAGAGGVARLMTVDWIRVGMLIDQP